MKTLNQLKEGDILYEYDFKRKFLNVLYVIDADYSSHRIRYKPIIVYDEKEYCEDEDGFGIWIWFPEKYNLEQPILVRYDVSIWSIFSTNYKAVEEFMIKEVNLKQRFKTALNMFTQREVPLYEVGNEITDLFSE